MRMLMIAALMGSLLAADQVVALPPRGTAAAYFLLWDTGQDNRKMPISATEMVGPFTGVTVAGTVNLPICTNPNPNGTWGWAVSFDIYDQNENFIAMHFMPGATYGPNDPTTVAVYGFLVQYDADNMINGGWGSILPGTYDLYATTYVYTGPTPADTIVSAEVWVATVTVVP